MTSRFKHCPHCNLTKSTDSFGKNKRCPDGLSLYCKSCANEKKRIWLKKNEKMIEEREEREKRLEESLTPEKLSKRCLLKAEIYRVRNTIKDIEKNIEKLKEFKSKKTHKKQLYEELINKWNKDLELWKRRLKTTNRDLRVLNATL